MSAVAKPAMNPVIYLAIVGDEYEWCLKPLRNPSCDAIRLKDFQKENPPAARKIRTRIALGKTSGKVPVLP